MRAMLERFIAESLETDERLLPLIPQLLADLDELGSSTDLLVATLRDLGLGAGHRALDLGCGKGAAAVALAAELGVSAVGVDGLAAFIDSARALAESRGVAARCAFRVGDLRDHFARTGDFDAVLLLSVGPIAGDHRSTVEGLRRLVRPGGLIVIDDGFLAPDAMSVEHYGSYPGREKLLHSLTAFGDRLLHETIVDGSATRDVNVRNTELIRRRAEELKLRHPAQAAAIDAYVARQHLETERLGRDLICALWVLERSRNGG